MKLGNSQGIRLVLPTLCAGGSERVAVLLANQWARIGLQVEIMLVRRTGRFLGSLNTKVLVYSPNARRTATALPALAKRLNSEPGMPVVLFGFDLGVGLGAMRRLGLVRAPLIFREGSLPSRNIAPRHQWAYRMLIGGCDGVIAQTRHAMGEMTRLGVKGVPSKVISNPFLACGGPQKIRDGVVGMGGLRVMAAGRLCAMKRFDRLLNAWPGVLREFPGARLTIVGEGPERAHLVGLIDKLGIAASVAMSGFSSAIENYYLESDIFVLPSDYEGQPNVLIEALHYGCRIVAAGGPAVREMLYDTGLGGAWVSGDNLEGGLVEDIKRALAFDRATMERAIGLLRARVTVETVASEYWNFCVEVANSSQQG